MYYSIQLFGINEILPVTTLEIAYSGIAQIIGAIVLAYSFATVAIIIAKSS